MTKTFGRAGILVLALSGVVLSASLASAATWSSTWYRTFASSTTVGTANCTANIGNESAGGYIRIAYTERYCPGISGCQNLATRYQFDVRGLPVPKQWSSWGFSPTFATRSADLSTVNFYQSAHKIPS
jgi:hypothetical protein